MWSSPRATTSWRSCGRRKRLGWSPSTEKGCRRQTQAARLIDGRRALPGAGARVLPDQAAGDADPPASCVCWPAATAHRQTPGAPAADARVLPDQAAGDAALHWARGFGQLLQHIDGRRGSAGAACGFGRDPVPATQISVGLLCWPMLQHIDGRQALPQRHAGSSGSSCRRRGAPLGSWIWPAATAHRRTPGAPPAACGFFRSRLLATRIFTECLVVGQCCSTSTDAGVRRGRAGSSGSSCRRRGAPLGSWIWPAATAHRQTPGAPAAGARVLPDQAAGDAELHWAPGFGQLLRLIVGRRSLPGAACGFFRIKLPATQISAGLLGVASCYGSSSDARRSPSGMRARSGIQLRQRGAPLAPGFGQLLQGHRQTPGAPPAACGLGPGFSSGNADPPASCVCWPMLQLIVGRGCYPPQRTGSVQDRSASDTYRDLPVKALKKPPPKGDDLYMCLKLEIQLLITRSQELYPI